MRARQQKQQVKEEQQADDSKKEENQESGYSSALPKKSSNPKKSDGAFLSSTFKPVSSSTPSRNNEKGKAEDDDARDDSPDRQKTRPDGPTTAESPLDRGPSDQPRELKFGADATWGNNSLWDKNSKPVNTLPKTEALLSVSKLGAKMPAEGLARPGLKLDAAPTTIDRIEPNRTPESAPRTFITPVNFQPRQAAPVNDLGNDSWAVDAPGKTTLGGSAPFSQEPSFTPSRPVESLQAPALPKPVSPWLK